jgi:hypothetical protein
MNNNNHNSNNDGKNINTSTTNSKKQSTNKNNKNNNNNNNSIDGFDGVPDLLVSGYDDASFIDIAVCCPSAPSYRKFACNSHGHAAQCRANQKQSHYKNIDDCYSSSALGRVRVVPFCMESYGSMNIRAVKLLSTICNNHWDVTARFSVWKSALTSLSFSLQRGNAMIARGGVASLRSRFRM